MQLDRAMIDAQRTDLAIIVDTFPATGTPDTRHMAYSARMGHGVLITSAAGGISTLEIKLPRRYSHSPVEMLDLSDLAATLLLVEEPVLHPPAKEELSFL